MPRQLGKPIAGKPLPGLLAKPTRPGEAIDPAEI
jgi:hypothetical protein